MKQNKFNKFFSIFVIVTFVSSCSSYSSTYKLLKSRNDDTSFSISSLDDSYFETHKKAISFENRFSEEYFKEFDKGDENLAISPYSVLLSLGMLNETTANNSSKEILDALDMEENSLRHYSSLSYKMLNRERTNHESVDVTKVRNSLWSNEGYIPKAEALNNLSNYYFTDSYEAMFYSNNKKANEELTEYIKKETNGYLAPDLEIENDVSFVLLNLLYLKSIWGSKELNYSKEDYEFISRDNSIVKEKFLFGKYNPGKILKTEKFSSFYTTGSIFNLYFIVPNDGYELNEVYKSEVLDEVINNDYLKDNNETTSYNTRCIFHSFEAKSNNSIKDVLKNGFNIRECMDKFKADLSKIYDLPLYVSEYKHIVKIKVDEKGVEGAAVTSISDAPTSADPSTIVFENFIVNRNFVFALTVNDIILFSGIVNKI